MFHLSARRMMRGSLAAILIVGFLPGFISIGIESIDSAYAAPVQKNVLQDSTNSSAVVSTAIRYVQAMVGGDRVVAGQLDFACQFRMLAEAGKPLASFPKEPDPVYTTCWEPIQRVNAEPLERRELGLHAIWPGKDTLVFFGDEVKRPRFAPSSFVSDHLAESPSGGGFRIQHVGTRPLGIASFRIHPEAKMVGAPASLVELRISYQDPLTSPASYAPGTYQWANPVKRPQAAMKALTLQWAVLSQLNRLGFPGDVAVVNLPVVPATATHPAVPFLTEYSSYVKGSGDWWGPDDRPDFLVASIGRAAQLPSLRDRVAVLNRVLSIDPEQADALTALTRDLFQAILEDGAAAHLVEIKDEALAARFSEFYWDTYAQTARMDISLTMEMGGFSQPTPADYLFRMIPAMEKLAQVRPQDLENRLRLGITYRWNLDQLTAIETHEALVKLLPAEKGGLRARALTELAWSRITKVAFNRTFDDPGIRAAYREAQEALTISESPIDKFAAAYTMAYSLVFIPDRDNRDILELLTTAKRWYLQVAGASEDSWQVLLGNETLKAVIDADPTLQPLVALQE